MRYQNKISNTVAMILITRGVDIETQSNRYFCSDSALQINLNTGKSPSGCMALRLRDSHCARCSFYETQVKGCTYNETRKKASLLQWNLFEHYRGVICTAQSNEKKRKKKLQQHGLIEGDKSVCPAAVFNKRIYFV